MTAKLNESPATRGTLWERVADSKPTHEVLKPNLGWKNRLNRDFAKGYGRIEAGIPVTRFGMMK